MPLVVYFLQLNSMLLWWKKSYLFFCQGQLKIGKNIGDSNDGILNTDWHTSRYALSLFIGGRNLLQLIKLLLVFIKSLEGPGL